MKVYLYELDSVRNSAAEIQVAQERLIKEIYAGNTVVLSDNQILDGMGFTGVLYGEKGEENYQTILKLFQSGLVKVCKFTDLTTNKTVESLGEYWLQNKMRKQFVHSGINLEQDNEVREKVEKALSSANVLLVEQWAKEKRGPEKEKAEYVYHLVKLMYELGAYDIWVEEEKGIKRVKLAELLEYVLNVDPNTPLLKAYPDVQKALDVLRETSLKLKKKDQEEEQKGADEKHKPSNFRSKWYKALKLGGDSEVDVPSVIHIARHIIDLCYAVTIESGISGVYLSYMMDSDKKEEKQNLTREEIRELQCSYVFEKLAEDLEPKVSTLCLPPWKDAFELIEEIGIKNKDNSKQKTRSVGAETVVRVIELVLALVIWVLLASGLNIIVFPHIEILLDYIEILLNFTVPDILRYILSEIISALLIWLMEKILILVLHYFRPDVPIKGFGLELARKIAKILNQEVQINNYLQRMGWFSRHFKNLCTYCKKNQKSITIHPIKRAKVKGR